MAGQPGKDGTQRAGLVGRGGYEMRPVAILTADLLVAVLWGPVVSGAHRGETA